MRSTLHLAVSVLALCCAVPGEALAEDEQLAEARRFFERFVNLERSFDPAGLDLYADEARIVVVRKYPAGLPDRVVELSGAQYKKVARPLLPAARAINDRAKYFDLRFSREGDGVRITGKRYSERKRFTGTYSVLIQRDASGDWRIVEERGESAA